MAMSKPTVTYQPSPTEKRRPLTGMELPSPPKREKLMPGMPSSLLLRLRRPRLRETPPRMARRRRSFPWRTPSSSRGSRWRKARRAARREKRRPPRPQQRTNPRRTATPPRRPKTRRRLPRPKKARPPAPHQRSRPRPPRRPQPQRPPLSRSPPQRPPPRTRQPRPVRARQRSRPSDGPPLATPELIFQD